MITQPSRIAAPLKCLFFTLAALLSLQGAIASERGCLIGESLLVGEGNEAVLSGNGEVVAYECDDGDETFDSICIRDFSTTPPTDERLDPDDPDFQTLHQLDISNDGQRLVYVYRRSSSNITIELYDRATGETSTLIAGDFRFPFPRISGNGEYVVFAYDSDELSQSDRRGEDIFRYEIATGNIEVASLANDEAFGDETVNDDFFDISDDGNIVVFQSEATNLVAGDTNDSEDVFYRDMAAGNTRRAGLSTAGQELYYGAIFPKVSGDGSSITFEAADEAAGSFDEYHLVAYSVATGNVSRLARTTDGNDDVGPTLTRTGKQLEQSADGRFTFFESKLDNLVTGGGDVGISDDFGEIDLFVYDRDNGSTRGLSFASIAPQSCMPVYLAADVDTNSAGDKIVYSLWLNEDEGNGTVLYLATLPDTEPPRVSLNTTPSKVDVFSILQLIGGQIDDVAASERAEYRVNGGAWQSWPFKSQSPEFRAIYQEDFPLTGQRAGRYEFCARAYDARGNVGYDCEYVDVADVLPVADSIIVQCLHEPVWPKPGETVTVTATAFAFDPSGGRVLLDHFTDSEDGSEARTDRRKSVDNLEIWVNDRSQPAAASASTASSFTHSFTADGDWMTYGCRIRDDDETAFSGWKQFGIGDYPFNRAIPIQKTNFPENAIDIVFIADKFDYTSAQDPNFSDDIYRLLKYGLWNHTDFLKDQDRYNIWLARDMGVADRGMLFGFKTCPHQLPTSEFAPNLPNSNKKIEDLWLRYYLFSDTAAIVHRREFRDCAPAGRNVYSVDFEKAKVEFEDSDITTVRHETAHRPFQLADEYCCDGGYHQADELPNLYEERDDCEADVAALGRVPSDCREFIEDNLFSTDWYISDPPTNDIAGSGYRINANDKRRIDWFYRQCEAGRC